MKVPVEFVVKLTVPVGVVGLDDVSVTFALQLVAVPVVTEAGEQETLVAVTRSGTGITARTKDP